jgi:GAF domain-containing protein
MNMPPPATPAGGSGAPRRVRRHRADIEILVLREIVAAVTRSPEPTDALRRVAFLAAGQSGCSTVDLYWHEHARRRLRWCASSARPSPEIHISPGTGFFRWYGKTARSRIVRTGVSGHPLTHRFPVAQHPSTGAMALVPIMVGGRTAGLLTAAARTADDLAPALRVLEIVASAAASLVDNVRLRHETQRRQDELAVLAAIDGVLAGTDSPAAVLLRIAQVTSRLIGEVCSAVVPAAEGGPLRAERAVAVRSDGQPADGAVPSPVMEACRQACSTGKPAVVAAAGVAEPRAVVAVPLRSGETLFGAIGAWSDVERRFTTAEIAAFSSLADRAAAALENARLQRAVAEAGEELRARKAVERAKGILMSKLGMSEEDAYKHIHRKSMNTRKAMREIAEAIILAFETAP